MRASLRSTKLCCSLRRVCTLGPKKKGGGGHRIACESAETVQCLCSAETVQ